MITQQELDAQDLAAARVKAREVTRKHIARVRELLADAAARLNVRGFHHDMSKYEDVENEPLAMMQMLIDREGQAPYGTAEYKRRTDMLGPMLDHHYKHNSHHPEHYPNGVDDMDLFDVVEMFFDWKAASERGEESAMHISAACEKYRISPQLQRIFRNTAENLNFNHQ